MPLFKDDFSGGAIGKDWDLQRVNFAIQNGRLVALPEWKSGFLPGQDGSGRAARAVVHVGEPSWTDYRLSLDVENTGVSPAHNPYGIPTDLRAHWILFRVQAANESWNAPAYTLYALTMETRTCQTGPNSVLGNWSLVRFNGLWIPGTGWSPIQEGLSKPLTEGNTPAILDGMNHVEVSIKGSTITVRINGQLVVTHTDGLVTTGDSATYGPIPNGGIGVEWGWESLGWIDNVRVDPL
jgi:hypothetical protein